MFGLSRRPAPRPARPIETITERPRYVYAVGDIHGCLAQLQELEQTITQDIARHGEPALVVYLGDMIDRGPASAGVLDHLMSKKDYPAIMLAGNHEEMLLDFIADPNPRHAWLAYGGAETLLSYNLDSTTLFDRGRSGAQARLLSYIPPEHLDFIRSRPVCVTLPGITLVHAGMQPDRHVVQQLQQDMMWMRLPSPAFEGPQPFGLLVHGHTPAAEPLIEPYRICVDTGAFATGILTAARIDADGAVEIFSTSHTQRRNDNA